MALLSAGAGCELDNSTEFGMRGGSIGWDAEVEERVGDTTYDNAGWGTSVRATAALASGTLLSCEENGSEVLGAAISPAVSSPSAAAAAMRSATVGSAKA